MEREATNGTTYRRRQDERRSNVARRQCGFFGSEFVGHALTYDDDRMTMALRMTDPLDNLCTRCRTDGEVFWDDEFRWIYLLTAAQTNSVEDVIIEDHIGQARAQIHCVDEAFT